MDEYVLADLLRVVFFILAGLYGGVAVAVMRRYLRNPPRSRLRKLHVWGVSMGTTVLVVGALGEAVSRVNEPLVWYVTPVFLLGLALVTGALFLLFRDQSEYVPVKGASEIPVRDRRRRRRDRK